MSEAITLHCHHGKIDAAIGDRFGWWDRTEWEIVSFTSDRIYSPSGFGGTPIVRCKHVGGDLERSFLQHVDKDGICEWCGDSVASALFNDYRGKTAPKDEMGASAASQSITPQENTNG